MLDTHSLLFTIVASIVMAFVFGLMAKLARLPALVGYLIAGMMLGPHTPGLEADQNLASQLAEIGIILLMFGVGLHFSIKDLMRVRKVVVPCALIQLCVISSMGAWFLLNRTGVALAEAIAFGVSISAASTVVLLRSLEQRDVLQSNAGHVAMGWLIVEDVVMVLAIVLLPMLAHTMSSEISIAEGGIGILFQKILLVLLKISVLIVLMVVVGTRLLPPLLVLIAKQKSKELLSLGTLAMALGFAYVAYQMFDASFALGAFLAGMVLSESDIGKKAAEQSQPMRDTFSVLFFVSVGMLFNPWIVMREPLDVLVTLAIIVLGKMTVAWTLLRVMKQPQKLAVPVAIGLAQIGEFSFVFAGIARHASVISPHHYDIILAAAILSIACNALLFRLWDGCNKLKVTMERLD